MTDEKQSKAPRKKGKRNGKRRSRARGETAEKQALGRPRHPSKGVLGERIDELALRLFGSRTKLAIAADMVPSRLSETIRGKTTPTTATLEKIAAACKLTLTELLGEKTA